MTSEFRAGCIWALVFILDVVALVLYIPSLGWSWRVASKVEYYFKQKFWIS